MPHVVLLGMVRLARLLACNCHDKAAAEWWSMAILLEVGYYGLLRPGELFALTTKSIIVPGAWSHMSGPFAIAVILKPKNKRFMGHQQFSVIRSREVVPWLVWLLAGMLDGSPLWPSSQARFRTLFGKLVEWLCLGDWSLTTASLRAGGTTWFFECGIEPNRLLTWGRWRSAYSLQHYLQEAMSSIVMHRLNAQSHALLSRLSSDEFAKFAKPPRKSWLALDLPVGTPHVGFHFGRRRKVSSARGQVDQLFDA